MKKEIITEDPKTGLIIVRHEMTVEQKRQRREDNRIAKKKRSLHSRRRKHGRQ